MTTTNFSPIQSNNSQFAQTSVRRCENPRIDESYEDDGKDNQISDAFNERYLEMRSTCIFSRRDPVQLLMKITQGCLHHSSHSNNKAQIP